MEQETNSSFLSRALEVAKAVTDGTPFGVQTSDESPLLRQALQQTKGNMSVASIAKAAAQKLASKAPNVISAAQDFLKKGTGGAVTSVTPDALSQYVKNDMPRMAVVAGALARAGVSPDEYITDEMAGQSSHASQVREMARNVVSKFVGTYEGAAASSGFPALQDTASVQFAMKAVRAALRVYGSKTDYMLCHPTGGIPSAAFDQYAALYNRVV